MKSNAAEDELVMVHIPKALNERVNRRLAHTEFKSVDGYVSYVVGQVLDEIEEGENQRGHHGENMELSEEDKKEVEQRLKDLGYL
jgi:hypothetical protein